MKPIKILFISRYIPFPGGRENFVFELSRELSRQGIDVHLVTPDGLLGDGFNVYPYFSERKKLEKIIKTINPDIVNSHTFYLCDPAIDICKENNIPFIITLHGDQFKIGDKQRQDVVKSVLARADLILTVCEEGKKSLISNTETKESKIRVVHNGVNDFLFKKDIFLNQDVKKKFRNKNGLPVDKFIWITPARMIWYKGLDILVEMILEEKSFLRENGQFFLITTPNTSTSTEEISYMNNLLEFIKKNDIGDLVKIIFSGYEYMPYLYQAVDAFVLPSIFEQLPISILEAMSTGLPVVSTNVGGISEIIENGSNGLLAVPKNKNSLGNKVKEVIDDKFLREEIVKKGLVTISKSFSIKKSAREYLDIYEDLINHK